MIAINLLAWREAKRHKERQQTTRSCIVITSIIITLLLLWHGALFYQLQQSATLLTRLKTHYSLPQPNNNYSLEKIKEQNQKLLCVSKINQELLKVISENTPATISLNLLTRFNEDIVIQGNAKQIATIAPFLQQLATTKILQQLAIQEITTTDDTVKFSLQAKLNCTNYEK
jgi:Tfp pilus assembly protein PilN